MHAIEIARKVVAERQCHLLRERKDTPAGTEGKQYDARPYGEGSKRGWTLLDGFTASAIVQVYDALNDKNRGVFGALPIEKMARVAMKLIK
jgi:hypothetical protein